MLRDRVARFAKNLAATLVHCALEEGDVVGIELLGLVVLGVFWLFGMIVYELAVDPHTVSAASLNALSIDPDKWISR